MKASGQFKTVINNYLQGRASTDPLFAETLKKENKNLDDCITYILTTVQKSGQMGFADEEIFGMAVHYYDEDNIEVGKVNNNVNVVVNHHVELSAEEKKEAHQKALDKAIAQEQQRLTSKKAVKKSTDQSVQPTLF